MTKTTLAAALLLAARAHADPQPSLELSVTGSIDAGVVATSIATELARSVTPLAPTERCDAPCLAIAVAGTSAAITFTSASGAARQRTIELGADRARWPEMITLLAGNLVRDEASELLPDPPSPGDAAAAATPAVPPIPAAPAWSVASAPPPSLTPHLEDRVSPIGFGLIPGASTDLFDVQRSHWISIGLVAGVSRDVRGFAVSGAVDVARRVSGLQLSGAVAVTGDVSGAQLAGAATVAEHSTGAQISGAVAVAGRAHVQIAGAVVAAADADVQIAGAITAARRATTQISGGVNVTRQLDGVQIGPINVARRNDGVQFGVINVGGGPDGDSFGLINIVPGGRSELEATIDSDKIGTAMFRHGGKHWHNVYGIGGQSITEPIGKPNDDIWMLGLGMGPSLRVANLPVDLEAMAWQVNHGGHLDKHLSLLNQLRLSVGVPLGPITLVAGGAINAYVSTDHASPLIAARTSSPDPMSTEVTVKVWPSLFVGARI